MSLNILIIESDGGRTKLIKTFLTKEIYSPDFENNWEEALVKVKSEEKGYDVIILSVGKPETLQEDLQLQTFLRSPELHTQGTAFIVLKAEGYEAGALEEILSGKNLKIINKDETDFCNQLDWAILSLKPKIFPEYLKKIEAGYRGGEKVKEIEGDLKKRAEQAVKNKDTIKRLRKDLLKMQDSHISWKSIAESLGILVGAFSLAVSIVIALIFLFLQEKVKGGIQFSFIQLTVAFFLFLILWEGTFLLVMKNKAKKLIRKWVDEQIDESDSKERS